MGNPLTILLFYWSLVTLVRNVSYFTGFTVSARNHALSTRELTVHCSTVQCSTV